MLALDPTVATSAADARRDVFQQDDGRPGKRTQPLTAAAFLLQPVLFEAPRTSTNRFWKDCGGAVERPRGGRCC